MNKFQRICLVVSLVFVLAISFVVPCFAVTSQSPNYMTHYPHIYFQFTLNKHENGVDQGLLCYLNNELYQPIARPAATSTDIMTLYPARYGNVNYKLETRDLRVEEYGLSGSFWHQWFVDAYYDVPPYYSSYLTSLDVYGGDFYLPPGDEEVGFFLTFEQYTFDDYDWYIDVVARPLGSTEFHSQRIVCRNGWVGFKADDLPTLLFFDTVNDTFKGAYIKEFTITWVRKDDPTIVNEVINQSDFRVQSQVTLFSDEAYQAAYDADLVEPFDATDYYADYTGWVATAISGFFDTQIFPGFTLGGIVLMVLAFAIVIWMLKIFAGG